GILRSKRYPETLYHICCSTRRYVSAKAPAGEERISDGARYQSWAPTAGTQEAAVVLLVPILGTARAKAIAASPFASMLRMSCCGLHPRGNAPIKRALFHQVFH